MASTGARMTARARARAAQQKVLVDRKRRDEANMASLTAFFTAVEQIDAAKVAMARALDDIRTREGTLSAAAALAGVTTGEARKLLAHLTNDGDGTSDGESATESAADDVAAFPESAPATDRDNPAGSDNASAATTEHGQE